MEHYFVYTQVTVVDDAWQPVVGVTVYIRTTSPNGEAALLSGITDRNGKVVLGVKSSATGMWVSEVTNVTGPLPYDPGEDVPYAWCMVP